MCEVSCECALRCFSTLTTEQRRTIFSRFWALGNFDIQNTYLCGCVKVLPVARHYTSESKRGNTRVYYVNGESCQDLQDGLLAYSWNITWSTLTGPGRSG